MGKEKDNRKSKYIQNTLAESNHNMLEKSHGMPRTDLALEIRESFEEDNVEIRGVILEEDINKDKDIRVTKVIIKDQKGADAMGKPIGTYITIEAPKLQETDENYHEPITEEITKYIKELVGETDNKEVLIVGLGNREVTPDALGPQVVDNLFVTRHLIREFGQEFQEKYQMGNMSAISPGVMGQTGMEASEVICGIVEKICGNAFRLWSDPEDLCCTGGTITKVWIPIHAVESVAFDCENEIHDTSCNNDISPACLQGIRDALNAALLTEQIVKIGIFRKGCQETVKGQVIKVGRTTFCIKLEGCYGVKEFCIEDVEFVKFSNKYMQH